MAKEYKKSYKAFGLWLLGMCVAYFGCIFVPIKDIQVQLAVVDNIMTISCFVLTWIIYKKEAIYWYNGTTFEAAEEAGSDRRKAFALEHMKRFGLFAGGFLVYSILSILMGLPYGLDIMIATIGLVVAAVSTIKIKL